MESKTTRREIIGAMICAVALTREELSADGVWITVATPGWNKNQRAYTHESLESMTRGLRGRFVYENDPLPDKGDIAAVMGIVSEARHVDDGAVQVQVQWFRKPGRGGVLTPTGKGKLEDKGDGYSWVRDYNPSHLAFQPVLDSAFPGATRISQ